MLVVRVPAKPSRRVYPGATQLNIVAVVLIGFVAAAVAGACARPPGLRAILRG